jgi:hypothetical protein
MRLGGFRASYSRRSKAAWYWTMTDNAINDYDYYVVTSRRGQQPERWSWEMHRKSKPLGIKMTGDGYQSDTAAQFAGKQALAEFLAELSKEEKRPRK